jgi:hypothetical protein
VDPLPDPAAVGTSEEHSASRQRESVPAVDELQAGEVRRDEPLPVTSVRRAEDGTTSRQHPGVRPVDGADAGNRQMRFEHEATAVGGAEQTCASSRPPVPRVDERDPVTRRR